MLQKMKCSWHKYRWAFSMGRPWMKDPEAYLEIIGSALSSQAQSARARGPSSFKGQIPGTCGTLAFAAWHCLTSVLQCHAPQPPECLSAPVQSSTGSKFWQHLCGVISATCRAHRFQGHGLHLGSKGWNYLELWPFNPNLREPLGCAPAESCHRTMLPNFESDIATSAGSEGRIVSQRRLFFSFKV